MGLKEKIIAWWQNYIEPQLQPALVPVPVKKNSGQR
jgi:hypothetical protein